MNFSEILDFLTKKFSKFEVQVSTHFKEQAEDRNLNLSEIKSVCMQSDVLALINQDDGRFKITFKYQKDKDLNIIVEIKDNIVRLITIYPCQTKRRTKK